MTHLWPAGESIQVTLDQQSRPRRFIWQKESYDVASLVQSWTVDTDWWDARGRVWRRYHALTTTDGLLCVLYEDHLRAGWFLSKIYD